MAIAVVGGSDATAIFTSWSASGNWCPTQ